MVSAKWGVPEISRIYARERLLDRLDQLGAFACTWVAAPAGYGKTCLATAYLQRSTAPSLWYTLDRSDGDVATFFADFRSGLRAACPEDVPLLQYSSDIQDPTAFARAFFKHAFAHVRGAHVLVLDDYQEVASDSPLHAVIATAIGALPRGMRLIILSREVPPPPLARAQTYDLVSLLRTEDLRLTVAEALAVTRLRCPNQDFREDSVEVLLDRADGWVAGFVLLLRHPSDSLAPPDTTEVLFEYFAREVLGGADVELRNFLLLTAWLPTMTAEMAERMTGHPRVEALLHALLQGNYFLSRTLSPAPLYRYHQLFRLFLLHHARATWSQDDQQECRRRAAAVLEEAGQPDAAAMLWREAGDWDSLTSLIRRAAPRLVEQARTQSLEVWLSDIPAEAVAERPWLQYWSGRSQVHRDPMAARRLFERAYRGFKEAQESEGVFLSWAGVCETYWIALDGTDPLRDWLVELDEMRRRWPSFATAEMESRVAFGAFFGLIASDPCYPRRDEWEKRLLHALDSDQPPDLRLMIANLLMFYYVWTMGDGTRAALVLDQLRLLASHAATAPLSVIMGHTWGDFSYESCFGGSMEKCQRIAQEARSVASERGAHLYDSLLWAIPAYAHLMDGRFQKARPFLENYLGILDSTRLFDKGMYYGFRAWEAWLDGRLTEALDAAQISYTYAKRFGSLHPIWHTTQLLFQIEMNLGHRRQALGHLSNMRRWLRRRKTGMERFGWALALAQYALESGRSERCRCLLRSAFALGRGEGYASVPYVKPETLTRLCALALDAEIEVDYARDLIRKHELRPPHDAPRAERWPWPVKVTTFGGLTLSIKDEPVHWPRKAQHKPIDLLRVLIAHGGHRVPSHRVVDELWPDAEGDAAANALKTTLHRLRKLLGRDDAVQLREGQISLNPACVWVDRWALEQCFKELDAVTASPPTAQLLHSLDTASHRARSLYQGWFLEKTDLPCAISPREALHRNYLRAIERLGAYYERIGMGEKAASCYEHAVEVDSVAKSTYEKFQFYTNAETRAPRR